MALLHGPAADRAIRSVRSVAVLADGCGPMVVTLARDEARAALEGARDAAELHERQARLDYLATRPKGALYDPLAEDGVEDPLWDAYRAAMATTAVARASLAAYDRTLREACAPVEGEG